MNRLLLKQCWWIASRLGFATGLLAFVGYVLWSILTLSSGQNVRDILLTCTLFLCITGGFATVMDGLRERKLQKLKASGLVYSATISELAGAHAKYIGISSNKPAIIRFGPYADTTACCNYIDVNGRTCNAQSHRFLWTRDGADEITALVYVNPQDDDDYAVAINWRNKQNFKQ